MLEGEFARIYERLWRLDEAGESGWAVVFYRTAPFEAGESGKYMQYTVRPDGRRHERREIWVRRERAPSPQDEPSIATATLDELIMLAHERGHNESDRRGTYKANSLAEERRAWQLARELLARWNFGDWGAFDAHEQHSLAEHERRGTPP